MKHKRELYFKGISPLYKRFKGNAHTMSYSDILPGIGIMEK